MGKIISNGITYSGGLSFTPVQQNGGIGQGTNKVCIGWASDSSGLKATVDATDLGTFVFSGTLNNYLPLSGGTMTGNITGNGGGVFATDGNVYLKTGGYSDWLSNILNTTYRNNLSSFFSSGTPLLINGNAISRDLAHFCLEYGGSYVRFRNDGGALYIMNGNSSTWTNYISFLQSGQCNFPADVYGANFYDSNNYRCITGYGTYRPNHMTCSEGSSGLYLHLQIANAAAHGISMWQSDIKLKKNINETKVNSLEKINEINFIEFDWKRNSNHINLGVSANQLEEVIPEAVFNVEQPEDSEYDSLKNIDHNVLITYALKAIQELSSKVDQLEETIQTQQETINNLLGK